MTGDYLKDVDLYMFCESSEAGRESLKHPMLDEDGYVYCSDGRVGIRFKPWEGSQFKLGNHPAAKLDWPHERLSEFFEPLPNIETAKYKACNKCKGFGKTSDCDDCDGVGEVECECCGHSEECEFCSGRGYYPDTEGEDDCRNCNGLGKLYDGFRKEHWPFALFINPLYIIKLQHLKNVKLNINYWDLQNTEGSEFALPPIHFIFDGGEGLLMSLKYN